MATRPEDDRSDATTQPMERKSKGLQAGDVLAGRFELVSKLGQGGSGEVWKAVYARLGINVAIKVPLVRDTDTLERFRREAQALCLIDSENVLRCFEFGETPIPYLVMELLKGESLADRLEREGPMPLSTVKEIGRQVCKGLHASHRIGVVHRDLKPGNIYCIGERFKIVDFGLMKLVERASDPATNLLVGVNDELTRPNTVMGTLVYMSPEQVRHASRVDFRSDLWSLGVVLYRLLTAQQPFAAKAQWEIIRNIVDCPPPPISKFVQGLSPEVDAFFGVALHKDPSRRFSSAIQLGEAFDAIPDIAAQTSSLPNVVVEPPTAVVVNPFAPVTPSPSIKLALEEMSTVPADKHPAARGVQTSTEAGDVQALPAASVTGEPEVANEPAATTSVEQGGTAKTSQLATTELKQEAPVEVADTPSGDPDAQRSIESPARPVKSKVLFIGMAVVLAALAVVVLIKTRANCDAFTSDCDGSMLNGCESSLASIEHCGACAVACENPHGQTSCVQGNCVPACAPGYGDKDKNPVNGCEAQIVANAKELERAPRTLAAYEKGAFSIDVDPGTDGAVMWTIPESGMIRRITKNGGAAEAFTVGGRPTRIAFYPMEKQKWIWTDSSDGYAYRLMEDGTWASKADPLTKDDKVSVLKLTPEWIILSYKNSIENSYIIDKVNRKPIKRSRLKQEAGATAGPMSMAASSTMVYQALAGPNGSILAISHVGPAKSWTIAGQANPTAIVVDPSEKIVVWAKRGGGASRGAIVAASADGQGTKVLALDENDPRALAVDEKWVYWTNADGDIKKAQLDGGGSIVRLASSENDPVGVAVDDGHIYWVNRGSGEVRSLVK